MYYLYLACPSPKYGHDCDSTCHCKDIQCDNVNGVCTTPGCIAGYKGLSCDEGSFTDQFWNVLKSNAMHILEYTIFNRFKFTYTIKDNVNSYIIT